MLEEKEEEGGLCCVQYTIYVHNLILLRLVHIFREKTTTKNRGFRQETKKYINICKSCFRIVTPMGLMIYKKGKLKTRQFYPYNQSDSNFENIAKDTSINNTSDNIEKAG